MALSFIFGVALALMFFSGGVVWIITKGGIEGTGVGAFFALVALFSGSVAIGILGQTSMSIVMKMLAQ